MLLAIYPSVLQQASAAGRKLNTAQKMKENKREQNIKGYKRYRTFWVIYLKSWNTDYWCIKLILNTNDSIVINDANVDDREISGNAVEIMSVIKTVKK